MSQNAQEQIPIGASRKKDERIYIAVPPGPLTKEQQVAIMELALSRRFSQQLNSVEPNQRKRVLNAMALAIVEKSDKCAKNHLLRDGSAHINLTRATEQECQAFSEMLGEIVVIGVAKPKTFGEKVHSKVKYAAGVTWVVLMDTLGIKEREEKYYGSATGPRG